MSSSDEKEGSSTCQVCQDFEPQAWRKSLCRNCFHSLDEHSEELLAAEAVLVAKEMEAREKAIKDGTLCEKHSHLHSHSPSAKMKTPQVASPSKGKVPDVNNDAAKAKTLPKVGKTTPPSTKATTPPSSSSSTKSLPRTMSSSSTATTPPTTKTNSSSAASPTSVADSSTKITPPSKAKSVASKFETKPTDKSIGSKTDAKPSDKSSVSKTDPKPLDKSYGSKTDPKNKSNDNISKLSPKSKLSDQNKSKEDISDKNSAKATNDSKDKKSAISSKPGEKDIKETPSSRSKAAPFGKDMLKSSKDSQKKENKSNDIVVDKGKTAKDAPAKDVISKPPLSKTLSNDKKVIESKTTSKAGDVSGQRSQHTHNTDTSPSRPSGGNSDTSVPGKTNDVTRKYQGDAGKNTAPSLDTNKASEKDKLSVLKDRGKDKGGGGGGSETSTRTSSSPSTAVDTKTASPHSPATGRNNKRLGVTSPTPSSLTPTSAPSTPASSSPFTSPILSPTSTSPSPTPSLLSPTSKPNDNKRPKDLRLNTADKTNAVLGKFKELEKKSTTPTVKDDVTAKPKAKPETGSNKVGAASPSGQATEDSVKLKKELDDKEDKLRALEKQVSKMQNEMKKLEEEKQKLKAEESSSKQNQKDDMEKLLQELRGQLSKMSKQCDRLQGDNQSLLNKLHEQEERVQKEQSKKGKNTENVQLEEDLEVAERELEEVKDENKELQSQIMEMKNEMDEMYDHFRENEHDEFRELQKELDMTAKNCRILQFKLRKAERRNEQIEEDRIHYEEKLRLLQSQFDSQDAKNHIRVLEEELRVAKEVSVRLHDELDIVEDKRGKAMEENRHLTELLEHTDKRQFRLEMEIDKLREVVSELKLQLKEAKSNNNKESSPDRKLTIPPIGTIGKQGSKEYDVSQLMKDLCDCMERENDLKDQLKFTEEEAKMMRKRVSEIDDENENLRRQLQKMSEKASKNKKRKDETQRELDEERRQSEVVRAALASQGSSVSEQSSPKSPSTPVTPAHPLTPFPILQPHPVFSSHIPTEAGSSVDVSTDVVLVVGPEGSDIIRSDEPIPVSQRKDSTDEDLMNVMQLRCQLEMMEQELVSAHKKHDDLDLENENLTEEVKFLQTRLEEMEKERQESKDMPESLTPNAFYEDKLKELNSEVDDLRWKCIEKDREIERMGAVQEAQTREQKASKKTDKLKKSKSLEAEADQVNSDLKKQLEQVQNEMAAMKTKMDQADDAEKEVERLKEQLELFERHNMKLSLENADLKTRKTKSQSPSTPTTPVVSIQADDAAIQNIELKDKIRRLEEENKGNMEVIRGLTDDLQRLSRDTRSIATSPTVPGARSLLDPKTESVYFPVPQASSLKGSRQTSEDGAPTSPDSHKTRDNGGKEREVRFDLSAPTKEKVKVSSSPLTEGNTETKKSKAGNKGKLQKQTRATEEEKANDKVSVGSKMAESSSEKEKDMLVVYADGRSKINISGEESRVELMEKVLDMDDEISALLTALRKKDEEKKQLIRDIKELREEVEDVKDEGRRTEMDLLQELDMLHDKNSVMSNLLDIINERAEAAEEELEKRIQEDTGQSPTRSTSNVSQVSALSDTSMGSDDVFAGHMAKDGVITRDWEAKLKVRIESLERLLAEERQKVTTAEKKLMLAGIDSLSPSVSDDVKLRMREKELLQEELLKSQRHLHIATDQIQGLKERISIIEEEYERLKKDYAKLYEDIDKPKGPKDTKPAVSNNEKTPENTVDTELPFVAKKISVVEAPKYKELRRLAQQTPSNKETTEIINMEAELAKYKEKARELEYKVEEINDIWKSKSTASDKEKDELEKQLKEKIRELNLLDETILTLKRELYAKDKIIAENEVALREREHALSRKASIVRDREGESKKYAQDQQALLTQISQRDGNIRGLNETIRIRDERLKEKDEILFKLNTGIDEQKQKTKALEEKLNDLTTQMTEKDAIIGVLRTKISTSLQSTSADEDEAPHGETDAEKECFRLKEDLKKVQGLLEKNMGEKRVIELSLEKSRQSLDEAMSNWGQERNTLQRDINVLEEKVRLYDAYNRLDRDETIDTLKLEVQDYFKEKEALSCELSALKMKAESTERTLKEQMAKLQGELSDKMRLLKVEVDNNEQMNTELDRLRRQAEMAYRLQQEERILRAEHMSLKVRYESRIDKMNKENNKMLVTISKMTKERELDKEIIQSIQSNFAAVKEKYTEELLRSEEDKASLDRQMKEIDESRALTDQLQRQLREVREQCLDQERLRAELINKFATDRASWEISKANLNSQINQMEEVLSNSSRQQERSKDIQVNMGMAWDKERREQRRLLQEAHTLALDLQEQLRARDEAFAHERKELLRQMESDRLTWTKDKRDTERKMTELDSAHRKITSLQKQLKEAQDKCEREVESWRHEKSDLLRQLTECKHVQARDSRKVEDVLGGLIQLRELGTLLQSQEKGESLKEKPPDKLTDQNILTYVKEAVCQISLAADELSKYTNPPPDGAVSCVAGAEVQMVKDELSEQFQTQEGSKVFLVADVTTRGNTTTSRIEEQTNVTSRRITSQESHQSHSSRDIHTYTAPASVPGTSTNDSHKKTRTPTIGRESTDSVPDIHSPDIAGPAKPLPWPEPPLTATAPVFTPSQPATSKKSPTKTIPKYQTQTMASKSKSKLEDSQEKPAAESLKSKSKSILKQKQQDIAKSQTSSERSKPPSGEVKKQISGPKLKSQKEKSPSATISKESTKLAVSPQRDSKSGETTIPVIIRTFDQTMSSRYQQHAPSYTSGSRSACTSRATTPDISDRAYGSREKSPSGLPQPPPSLIIPHHRVFQSKPAPYALTLMKSLSSALGTPDNVQSREQTPEIQTPTEPTSASQQASDQASAKPKRPSILMKSLSVDSPSTLGPVYHSRSRSGEEPHSYQSVLAATTPTTPTSAVEKFSSGNLKPITSSTSSLTHKFSPRTARRKFFEEPNLFPPNTYNPNDYNSWQSRRSASPSVYSRQASLPDPSDVRREAEESHDSITTRKEPRPGRLRLSASFDEKMHHRIYAQDRRRADNASPSPSVNSTTSDRSITSVTSCPPEPLSPSNSRPTSSSTLSAKPPSAKDKRKSLFKKSTSLDSTVGSSLAKAGVSAMPPGAPSGFSPSDIFAAWKGKLKPLFKRKQNDKDESKKSDLRSPSPLFIQTEVPTSHANFGSQRSTQLPVPAPHVDVDKLETHNEEDETESTLDSPKDRSRTSSRQIPAEKWRSQSMDPTPKSSASAKVDPKFPFNETPV